jgi:hypothetical protein
MKRWVDHDRIVCESLMSKNTGEQILVVDDEAIRWTLSEALQSWGCAAIEAGPRSKRERWAWVVFAFGFVSALLLGIYLAWTILRPKRI